MAEFSRSVVERIDGLPATPAKPALQDDAAQLRDAITQKRSPTEVAKLARGLASALLEAHPVPLAPTGAPDVASATHLFSRSQARRVGKECVSTCRSR